MNDPHAQLESLRLHLAALDQPARMRSVTHDVKAQLNNIIGYIQLIRRDPNLTESDLAEMLEAMLDSALLVNTLMDAALQVETM